jgi:hypothetical protein
MTKNLTASARRPAILTDGAGAVAFYSHGAAGRALLTGIAFGFGFAVFYFACFGFGYRAHFEDRFVFCFSAF